MAIELQSFSYHIYIKMKIIQNGKSIIYPRKQHNNSTPLYVICLWAYDETLKKIVLFNASHKLYKTSLLFKI